MNKKNIILLIFAVVFLILAIIFFVISGNIEFSKDTNNLSNIGNTLDKTVSNTNTNIQNVATNTLNEVDYQNAAETGILNPVAEYKNFLVFDASGAEISLDSYAGKPVFILFWQVNQPDSIDMLKTLNSVYENYKDDVIFLSVTDIATKTEVEPVLQENSIQMPMYYEELSSASSAYEVTNYPTSIIKDKNNNIVNTKVGKMEEDTILANLDILSENF